MSVGTRSREHALALDAADPLTCLREEFVIPTRGELLSKTLAVQEHSPSADTPCIYLCGNSLGLQPRRTATRITQYLQTWASRGVYGHFKPIEDSPLPPWVSVDEVAAEQMAKVVGAAADEVAVMGSLTANLHLMMASFYRPDKTRHKIILEGKAFPSDHVCIPEGPIKYAVESQIRHHNLSPSESMILVEPQSSDNPTLTTEQILKVIGEHASTTALILLPGIQYYTGQYFDIPTITSYAHSKGLLIGWDLAHAVGNVELHLHDWDVDFAVWCNYKYMNSGPGAIAGAFVHERHGKVDLQTSRDQPGYRPRLSGWWGGDRTVRFAMDNKFIPIPGAAGYQVSNPSAIDTTAVCASLEVFNDAGMAALRERSIRLTAYLQCLLLDEHTNEAGPGDLFRIITPLNLAERGAQLSVLLQPGLLDPVMEILEEEGVVVDERRPDVIRVAPAPLYNSFLDVWEFVRIFKAACRKAWSQNHAAQASSAMVDGGKDDRGWSQIK